MKKVKSLILLCLCFIFVLCLTGCINVGQNFITGNENFVDKEELEIDILEETTKISEEKELKREEKFETLPFNPALDMIMTSGAGAWEINLLLSSDGSFSGTYYDSDAGDIDDSYPNGTRYVCDFWGKMSDIKQITDYKYTFNVEEFSSWDEDGTEYLDEENGVLNITSYPDSLLDGSEFVLYLKNTPVSELPEEAKNWIVPLEGDFEDDIIDMYVLYNPNDDSTFWCYTDTSNR